MQTHPYADSGQWAFVIMAASQPDMPSATVNPEVLTTDLNRECARRSISAFRTLSEL